MGEKGEGVVSCCFSRGFDLLSKDRSESWTPGRMLIKL